MKVKQIYIIVYIENPLNIYKQKPKIVGVFNDLEYAENILRQLNQRRKESLYYIKCYTLNELILEK